MRRLSVPRRVLRGPPPTSPLELPTSLSEDQSEGAVAYPSYGWIAQSPILGSVEVEGGVGCVG